ncbi:MAG TPA: hypothetical protein VGD98_02055 [Ktedonobacteraceae bacterium]
MVRTEISTDQEQVAAPRRRLSGLEKTAAVALFLNAGVFLFQFFFVWLAVGPFLLDYLIFSLVTALVAVLLVTRVRMAALLSVIVILITSSIDLASTETSGTLLHPAVNPYHFGSLVFLFAFAVLALITAGAVAIHNLRVTPPATSRWLTPFVTGINCLALGMLVVALIVAANPVGASANTSTSGMPTVHTAGSNFLTNVVLVSKGSKLQIVNDDSIEHVLENGFWTPGGTPNIQAEAGAPAVKNIDLKTGSIEIGPFLSAGIFHLYCTVHRGMNLTIVVQ